MDDMLRTYLEENRKNNPYVEDLTWGEAVHSVKLLKLSYELDDLLRLAKCDAIMGNSVLHSDL